MSTHGCISKKIDMASIEDQHFWVTNDKDYRDYEYPNAVHWMCHKCGGRSFAPDRPELLAKILCKNGAGLSCHEYIAFTIMNE